MHTPAHYFKGNQQEMTHGPIAANVLIQSGDILAWNNGLLEPATDAADIRVAGAAIRYKHSQPTQGMAGDGVIYNNTGGPAGAWMGEAYEPGLLFSKAGKIAMEITGSNPKPGDRVHVLAARLGTVDATTHNVVVGSLESPFPHHDGWWWVDLEDTP